MANENAKSKVNITGRVAVIGLPTTITSNGKTLTKEECTLTDETGSIRLVLCEEDTKRIQSGNTYKFCNAIVKSIQKQKYMTLNKQTSISNHQVLKYIEEMQSQKTTLRTQSHAQLKQLKGSPLICSVPNTIPPCLRMMASR